MGGNDVTSLGQRGNTAFKVRGLSVEQRLVGQTSAWCRRLATSPGKQVFAEVLRTRAGKTFVCGVLAALPRLPLRPRYFILLYSEGLFAVQSAVT